MQTSSLARWVGYSALGLAVFGVGTAFSKDVSPYTGSRFSEVWGVVQAEPYAELPQEKVSLARFFSWTRNKLLEAGKRTVSNDSDVLPRFEKLVHPNGICLKGTWNITEASPYTGYFESGRRGLIIARASVALSDTEVGSFRGFGLAGKIFPTDNPKHVDLLKTANFFVIDDLGGTKTEHYMDAAMTNEPSTTVNPSAALSIAPLGAAAATAFRLADANPGRRQVYPIAELGLRDKTLAKTPRWMMIRGAAGTRFDVADFRNELATAVEAGPVELDILVSDDRDAGWTRLGFVEFDEAVASEGCDHRLHFAHPKFRKDLP